MAVDISGEKRGLGGAKEKIAEFFEFPRDSILDVPRIVVMGNVELSVENHLGIIGYTSGSVEIAVSRGKITVRGKDLAISSITKTSIGVQGLIEHVDFSA